MEGGTTFYFVTESIHSTLERARDAAGGRDARLGGGLHRADSHTEGDAHRSIAAALVVPNLAFERTRSFHR